MRTITVHCLDGWRDVFVHDVRAFAESLRAFLNRRLDRPFPRAVDVIDGDVFALRADLAEIAAFVEGAA